VSNKNLIFNNYNLYLITVFIFWITSILLYFFLDDYVKAGSLENGVKIATDSKLYIRVVTEIINGEASILDWKSKIGYFLFLTPFIYFDIPFVTIVFFQFFLTAISALCLYKITTKFFCKLSGIICVALFLLYFPLQIRNFYILTEMLFIDVSIFLTYLIVFYKKQYLPLIILLLTFLISIRPNGMLFLFSLIFCILLFLINHKKKKYLSLFLISLLIATLPVYHLINAYFENLRFIESLNRGIIWGWSFENNQICKALCLSNQLINNNYQNSLIGYLQFAMANFFEYFKIFFFKIFWLIARARPYYSNLHNYYIIFFNLIFYLGFIYGFIKRPKNNFSIRFIIFFILLSMILVGLTFADWSGRFSLYFLPFVMIFSSYGILIFIKKILKMINQKRNNIF
tara:strand:+ start:285 stop:1484 length:1200 start_codon:yes stop_codon:yes gene_type:complete